MGWQVQSIILAAELAAGAVLFRFFIPFFRRVKTGRFDLYIGDRFKKDGSEPKFAGVVMAIISVTGLALGLLGESISGDAVSGQNEKLSAYAAAGAAVLLITALGVAEDYNKETK